MKTRRLPERLLRYRRGSALYVSVLMVSLLVSILGLAGLTVMRVESRRSQLNYDLAIARLHARSAVERGSVQILDNPETWRNSFQNGVNLSQVSLGDNIPGTLSCLVTDTDGSLQDADTELWLKGLGRAGDVVQVARIRLEEEEREIGPQTLRSMTSSFSLSDGDLRSDRLWCQYLRPVLPDDATGWWITGVELYCYRKLSGRTVQVRIVEPLATNWPGTNQLDSSSRNTSGISSSADWHTFNLGGEYRLEPDQGVCVVLWTASSDNVLGVYFRNSGLTETNSALLRGIPNWGGYRTDQALRYRINGVYTETTGRVLPIPGTWEWGTP